MIRKLMRCIMRGPLAKSEDGVVAVEFALVVVPFLMLIFGIFETGQVLWASSQIDFHVDRVVRTATVDSSMSVGSVQSLITAALDDLDAANLVVSVTRTSGTPEILRISVVYTHMPVTPFLFEDGIVLNHSSAYPMIGS